MKQYSNIKSKLIANIKLIFCFMILFVYKYSLNAAEYCFVQNTYNNAATAISNDTLKQRTGGAVSGKNKDDKLYTATQDSAYNADSRLSLPFIFWIKKGLERTDAYWKDWLQSVEDEPSQNLSSSFAKMPKNIFDPMPTEIVQYEINRTNALSIPTISTFSNAGLNVNLKSIGTFLRILEDVSPDITYTLTITADVEIVVYSVSAKVIATIFTGTQKSGRYKVRWNGKNDDGKKMPAGDYIAEVRIGAEKYVRKRIVIE